MFRCRRIRNIRVEIFDLTTKESLGVTTDNNGEYIEDLANLPSGYSNGDGLRITTKSRGYRQRKFMTVDTSLAGNEVIFSRSTARFITMRHNCHVHGCCNRILHGAWIR